jgi:hypothetical protein
MATDLVNFLAMFYQEQNRTNCEKWENQFKELLRQLADYEQELYEKDRQIQQRLQRKFDLPNKNCTEESNMEMYKQ